MAEVRISANVDAFQAHEKLDRAIRALEPPSLTESMGAGADIFVDEMKARVPVDTGKLQSVITKEQNVGAVGWEIGPLDGSYAETPYANIQDEGGTNYGKPYMILPGGYRYHEVTIPGTHYVMEAFNLAKEEAIEVVKAEVLAKI